MTQSLRGLQKFFFICGCVLAMTSIMAGAFASHVLASELDAERLNIFDLAVRYQMQHAFALLILALAVKFLRRDAAFLAGWLFLFGTFIFSGSLYLLSLSGQKVWGAVTPIGGVLFLLGWIHLILSAFRLRTREREEEEVPHA